MVQVRSPGDGLDGSSEPHDDSVSDELVCALGECLHERRANDEDPACNYRDSSTESVHVGDEYTASWVPQAFAELTGDVWNKGVTSEGTKEGGRADETDLAESTVHRLAIKSGRANRPAMRDPSYPPLMVAQ